MNCEDTLQLLREGNAPVGSWERDQANAHLIGCSDCNAVVEAYRVMQKEISIPSPIPSPGAVSRAVSAALRAHDLPRSNTSGFLRGMIAGAAIAAGVAFAIVIFQPGPQSPAAIGTPKITMTLNETRSISIAVDADQAMSGAEIYVLLTGDVELDGYAGQRELRWHTDLATGSNQLVIPVVAIGSAGGQLLVEVEHDMKRRKFLVDISGTG